MMQNDLMQYFNQPNGMMNYLGQAPSAAAPTSGMPQPTDFSGIAGYGTNSHGSRIPGYQEPNNSGLASVGDWQGAGAMQYKTWDMGDGAYMRNPFYGQQGAGSSISTQGSASPQPSMGNTGSMGAGMSSGGQGGMQRAAGYGGFNSMSGYGGN